MKDELKKLLDPHYGHLDFLLKIKRKEVSLDDMSNLIELINDKNLVSNLPKNLHKYNSYYTLMKDLFFVKKNIILLSNIKNNLSSEPKRIILSLIEDDSIVKKLNKIFSDEELKLNFLRWSSRIKDDRFARFYINSVLDDSKIFDIIDGEKSNLIELVDFEKHSKYVPSSWCIKKKSTFNNYLKSQRIFILKYEGRIYGVNIYKNGYSRGLMYIDYNYGGRQQFVDQQQDNLMADSNITIQNDKNKSLSQYDNKELYNAAKSELLKYDLFGVNDPKSVGVKNQKGAIRKSTGVIRRIMSLFRN